MGEIFFAITLSLLLSAFFSAIEIAYVSANPLRLTLTRNENSRTARLLNQHYARPDFFLGTSLIGNTITLVVYGIYMSKLIDLPIREYTAVFFDGNVTSAWFELAVFIAQTFVSTAIVLMVAEFTPKSLALAMPNAAIEVMIHFMNIFAFLLKPFVWTVVKTNHFLLFHVLGMSKEQDENKRAGIADLSHYLMNQSENQSEEHQNEIIDANIFQNAIEFKTRKVRQCMIPRTDIIAVDIKQSVEDLSRAFISTGHTKIIIFDGNLDNIVGYCHALKLFDNPQNIQEVVVPVLIVPETTGLQEMMVQFLTSHKSIAIVTDEFGGTSGIVTMEDVIEEILGDIEDEHDEKTQSILQINETEFEVYGKCKISDLKDDYGWDIPEGNYDTMAGLFMSVYGSVPELGTRIETEQFEMSVIGMKGVRIEKIKVVFKNR